MKKAVMEVVSQNFRPEFINRIDEMVVFHPLTQEDIQKITHIQLETLIKRLADKEIKIQITDSAIEYLSTMGFDPVYGARPLKRMIQQKLENPLAQFLLSKKFSNEQTLKVDKDKDKLIFMFSS
jgi:ATP-dependent Clp protease ATP-binding subunit ClpB